MKTLFVSHSPIDALQFVFERSNSKARGEVCHVRKRVTIGRSLSRQCRSTSHQLLDLPVATQFIPVLAPCPNARILRHGQDFTMKILVSLFKDFPYGHSFGLSTVDSLRHPNCYFSLPHSVAAVPKLQAESFNRVLRANVLQVPAVRCRCSGAVPLTGRGISQPMIVIPYGREV